MPFLKTVLSCLILSLHGEFLFTVGRWPSKPTFILLNSRGRNSCPRPVFYICCPTSPCCIFLWNTLPSSSAIYVHSVFLLRLRFKISFPLRIIPSLTSSYFDLSFLGGPWDIDLYYVLFFNWLITKPISLYNTFEAVLSCICILVVLYFTSVIYSYLLSNILNTANL